MTVSVVADVAADPHPTTSRVPRQIKPEPDTGPTVAVTLRLAFGERAADPAGLRALIEQVAELCGLPVVVQLVRADPADVDGPVEPDTVRLDGRSRSVHRRGEEIPLCRREFDLLLYLAEHPGQVFSHGQLLNAVWGDIFTGPRTVDVHIRRLRQKLGGRQPVITTVRGVGYRLATAPRSP